MNDTDDFDDLALLRMHVEAVWAIRLPPLRYGDIEAPPQNSPPPWTLYCAELSGGRVTIYRHAVAPAARDALAAHATVAQRLPIDAPVSANMSREVALVRWTIPGSTPSEAAKSVRRLGPEDAALMEAFEPGLAAYLLEAARSPVFAVVRDGRLLCVAHSSRRTSAACELGIETASVARRRGYALAATLRWAEAVQEERLVPLYSARASNAASLALAAAAGYQPFAHAVYLMGTPSEGAPSSPKSQIP